MLAQSTLKTYAQALVGEVGGVLGGVALAPELIRGKVWEGVAGVCHEG